RLRRAYARSAGEFESGRGRLHLGDAEADGGRRPMLRRPHRLDARRRLRSAGPVALGSGTRHRADAGVGVSTHAGGLPLPSGERVGVRGFLTLGRCNPSPAALRASTSPYGRGEESVRHAPPRYRAVRPPSTGTSAPVMKPAASDNRNTQADATSSGWPRRPSGISKASFCLTASGFLVPPAISSTIGPAMKAGHSALARIGGLKRAP